MAAGTILIPLKPVINDFNGRDFIKSAVSAGGAAFEQNLILPPFRITECFNYGRSISLRNMPFIANF